MTPLEIGIAVAVGACILLAVTVLALRSRSAAGRVEEEPLSVEDTAIRSSEAETELLDSSEEAPPSQGPSVLERFRVGLARTRKGLGGLFGGTQVDEALYESLEDALISSDVGVRTATAMVEELRGSNLTEPEALRAQLLGSLRKRLTRLDPALVEAPQSPPHVILVVGVNGSGKTTTIGKLAHRFRSEGRSVLLGAGDTFRAGAIEQLSIWAERSGAEFVAKGEGSDPAAVCFDALETARTKGHDVVLLDTAGRLQSVKPLMEELGKVHRVVGKAVPGAPHEVLLVLDGTMGQNAISQARTFKQVTGVTGVVLTKLDGTAKGGVVVAVMEELGLPVKFIGFGEQIDDLRPFDGEAFAQALL